MVPGRTGRSYSRSYIIERGGSGGWRVSVRPGEPERRARVGVFKAPYIQL